MHHPHVQVEWDHWRIESVRPDHILRVIPEPDAPRGRKASLMASYWVRAKADGAAGVLWQDPDIVCDPDDIAAMHEAIAMHPARVLVGVHKLWPASTMRDDWVWAHGRMNGTMPHMSQNLATNAEWFALGLTWTPRRLLDYALPHMPAWQFGQVDAGLGAVARQQGIAGLAVTGARPKHLHFYPRKDDASWRPGHVNDPS